MDIDNIDIMDEIADMEIVDDGSLAVLKASTSKESQKSDSDKDRINSNSFFTFLRHKPEADLEDLIDQEDIDTLMEKELENLQLIRKTNEWMKSFITSSKDALCKPNGVSRALPQSPKPDQSAPTESPSSSGKPHQRMFRKISNSFKSRRFLVGKQLSRDKRMYSDNINMIQTFVQDYYQSLGTVSRYLIVTSLLSFFSAFIVLYLYGAQTHSNDMELFKLKEHQYTMSQEALEKYQLHHENFRESLIHQQYEEHRKCKTLLETCQSNRDALTEQLSRVGNDAGRSQGALEMKLESQQTMIAALQEKLRVMQQNNRELRQELGQSVMSSYMQILVSLWNIIMNRSLQVFAAAVLLMCALINVILTVFPK